LVHVQPAKPTQNAWNKWYNRSCRTDVLDHYVFTMLEEVRSITGGLAALLHRQRLHRAWGLSSVRTPWHLEKLLLPDSKKRGDYDFE